MNTELLTEYWRARRPAFGCPPRSAVDPTQFLPLLSQVFILGRGAAGRYGFRLVGGLLADLHGRDLRQADFLQNWSPVDRASLQSAIEGAIRRSHPLVVAARAETADRATVELEILLAPLTGADGTADRLLGLYQPLSPLARLRSRPIGPLAVLRIGLADGTAGGQDMAEAPRLRLASLDGRRLA